MSNLQASRPSRVQRDWLLMGVPAAVGVLLSLGVAGLAVWPTWQRLQIAEAEREQLAEQRQRLPLLRTQLLKLRDNVDRAEQRRRQILGLIAGSGEINTFMAQLSAEAQRTGVILDGYEPITTAPPPEAESNRSNARQNKDKAPAPRPDPLLAPGLQKTSLLLTARGTGPQLLAFLRGLEKLSLLVVQSDLSLKHESKDAAKPGEAAVNTTQLRLNLSLYSSAEQPAKAP